MRLVMDANVWISTSLEKSAIDAGRNHPEESLRMNNRRYGLLVTLAASAFIAACGDSTPPAESAPQPSATASAEPAPTTTATAEATPPPEPPKPAEPPPPPPKPAKDKWAGKFVQDFSGDVFNAADADAKKKAGKNDKDNKKYNAALDKAKALVGGNVLETAVDGITWSVNGKAAHTIKFELVKGDEPNSLTVKFVQDNKKPIKKPIEVSVSFTDDDTISFKDPFAKKADSAATLVFKRQK